MLIQPLQNEIGNPNIGFQIGGPEHPLTKWGHRKSIEQEHERAKFGRELNNGTFAVVPGKNLCPNRAFLNFRLSAANSRALWLGDIGRPPGIINPTVPIFFLTLHLIEVAVPKRILVIRRLLLSFSNILRLIRILGKEASGKNKSAQDPRLHPVSTASQKTTHECFVSQRYQKCQSRYEPVNFEHSIVFYLNSFV